MAINAADWDDPHAGAHAPGGHAPAGGGHGAAAPHGAPGHGPAHGPAHGPVPIDINREPDMDHLLGAMQDTWFGRLKNIGAGSVNNGGVKNLLHGATTVLSGGILGSYGLNAKGSLNKELDRLVSARTGIDWNASLRVSDIWNTTGAKIKKTTQLSEKIRLCEEMEQYLDTFIAANGLAGAAAGRVRGAPARDLARARNHVAGAWNLAKAHPKVAAVAGVAGVVGVIALPVITIGTLTGGTLMAVSRFMEHYRGPVVDPMSINKTDVRELMNARRALSVIRADAEEKRAEILKKIEDKYKMPVNSFKRVRALIAGLKSHIGEDDAHKLVEEFEAAFNSADIHAALAKLLGDLEILQHGGNLVFSASTINAIDKAFHDLSSSGGGFRDYHDAIIDSIGIREATGPDAIGALIHRLAQVNALFTLRGRGVTLSDGHGATHDFDIRNVREQGGDFDLVLVPRGGHGEVIMLSVSRDPRNFRLVQLVQLVPSLHEIHAELATKTEHDLRVNPTTGHPDAVLVDLLHRAQTGRLEYAQYEQLLNGFVRHPVYGDVRPRALIAMIAAKTHEHRENLTPDITLSVD